MSPSNLKVLSLEDIVRTLRDPSHNVELLASMHARILGIGPTSAVARWLPTLRKYANNFQADFSPVLGIVPDPSHSIDQVASPKQENLSTEMNKVQIQPSNGVDSTQAAEPTENGKAQSLSEDAVMPANNSAAMASPANGHSIKMEKKESEDVIMAVDDADDQSSVVPSENGKTLFGTKVHTPFPALNTMETYSALTAEQRLRLLHTLTEIAASETVNHACSTRLLSLTVEELRLSPFGYDASGNIYWYFGDAVHLFREPGPRRAGRNIVESKRKSKTQLKILSAEKRARQQEKRRKTEERRRLADKKRKEKEERARKKEEERERKRIEARAKWAPRHPSARVTRGAKAAESAAVAAAEKETAPIVTKMVLAEDTIQEEEKDDDEIKEVVEGSTEIETETGGARQESPEENEVEVMDVDENEDSGEESEDTYDPAVRDCATWECVCDSVAGLKKLIERFGKMDNVKNKDEKILIRAMTAEILPLFEAAERKAVRAAKKEMMMQIASVRKRSARVMAMEAAVLSEREAKKEARMAIEAEAAEDRRIQKEDRYADNDEDEDHEHDDDEEDDEDDDEGYNNSGGGVQTRRSSARLSRSGRKDEASVGVTTRTRSSSRLS